jgi:hypothetical protein
MQVGTSCLCLRSCCGHWHAHSCDHSRNHQPCLPAERAAFSSGHKFRCGRPRRAKGSDSTSALPRFIFVEQPRHGKRMFPLDPASSAGKPPPSSSLRCDGAPRAATAQPRLRKDRRNHSPQDQPAIRQRRATPPTGQPERIHAST